MPKSRAKRKLRKRVERPDGRGDVDNELEPSVSACMCLCLCLSSCLLCLPADKLDCAGDLTGRGVRERSGKEGKKKSQSARTFRDATGQCDAMRYVRCNAMRFDGRGPGELTRLDLNSNDRPGRDGQGERGCPLYFSNQSVNQSIINRQSSTDIQPLCTVPRRAPAPKPQPQLQSWLRKKHRRYLLGA